MIANEQQIKLHVFIYFSLPILFTLTGLIGLYWYDTPYLPIRFILLDYGLIIFLVLLLTRKSTVLAVFRENKIPLLFIFLLTLGGLISTVLSIDFVTSLFGEYNRYEGYLSLLSYYLIFVGALLIQKQNVKQTLLFIFLGTGVLQGLYSLLQHDHGTLSWVKYAYGDASHGFVGNPNFFGSYVVLLFGVSCVAFCLEARRIYRLLYFSIALLFTACAIFTNTRGSWLGILAEITFLGIVLTLLVFSQKARLNRPKFKSALWGLVVLALSMGLLFVLINIGSSWQYLSRMNSVIDETAKIITTNTLDNSFGSFRGAIWKDCLSRLPQYWLHGCGVDTIRLLNLDSLHSPWVYIDKAHNELLQIALTQGIPTALAYLGFVVAVLIRGFKNSFVCLSQKGNWLDLALLVAFFGYLIQALLNISVITVAPYFWLIAGLMCGKVVREMK